MSTRFDSWDVMVWVDRYIPVILRTEHTILSCHPHLQLLPIIHLISGSLFTTLLSFLRIPETLIILNYFLFSKHATLPSLQAFENSGPLLGVFLTPPPHRKLLLFLHDSGQMQPSLMPQSALATLYRPFLWHVSQQCLRVQPLESEGLEFES